MSLLLGMGKIAFRPIAYLRHRSLVVWALVILPTGWLMPFGSLFNLIPTLAFIFPFDSVRLAFLVSGWPYYFA